MYYPNPHHLTPFPCRINPPRQGWCVIHADDPIKDSTSCPFPVAFSRIFFQRATRCCPSPGSSAWMTHLVSLSGGYSGASLCYLQGDDVLSLPGS